MKSSSRCIFFSFCKFQYSFMHMITVGGWACAEQQGLVSQVLLRALWTQNGSGGWNPGGGGPLLSLRCTISIIVTRTTTHYFPLSLSHTHTHTYSHTHKHTHTYNHNSHAFQITFILTYFFGLACKSKNKIRKEKKPHHTYSLPHVPTSPPLNLQT